jgi:hypothetical protein
MQDNNVFNQKNLTRYDLDKYMNQHFYEIEVEYSKYFDNVDNLDI